jgi:hypothetical protein
MKLSGHHRTTLGKLFAHPVNHNTEWHDVRSLLEHLGTVEEEHDGRLRVTLAGSTKVYDAPHHHRHTLDEQQVLDIRRMLADAGVTPDQQDQPD